jgi:GNAT superfamily N-acetyltransferase
MIEVKEVPIEEAVKVSQTIVEFDKKFEKDYFEQRYQGKEHLIIVGYLNNIPAGFIVGYNRDDDGSFYCWMVGTNPKFRCKGVLTVLMNYEEKWAKEKGYKKIRIKTRNTMRNMLANLVSKGFLFLEVETREPLIENRILLEKEIV